MHAQISILSSDSRIVRNIFVLLTFWLIFRVLFWLVSLYSVQRITPDPPEDCALHEPHELHEPPVDSSAVKTAGDRAATDGRGTSAPAPDMLPGILAKSSATSSDLGEHLKTADAEVHLQISDVSLQQASEASNGGRLLSHVSADASTGEVLAMMGPSGAGKTTLLNMLTGEAPGRALRFTGSITLNGQPLTPTIYREQAAYVEQRDVGLWPFLACQDQVRQPANPPAPGLPLAP